MYRSTTSRKVTPFIMSCKVCMDAGLPEHQYMSHNVKNNKGNVCCPTLLSNVCRKCEKFGHSEKYCTVQIKSTTIKTNKVISPSIIAKTERSVNAFDALDNSDSDSEDNVPANVTMRKPKTKVGQLKCPEYPASQANTPSSHKTLGCPNAPIKSTAKGWADYDSDDEDIDEGFFMTNGRNLGKDGGKNAVLQKR